MEYPHATCVGDGNVQKHEMSRLRAIGRERLMSNGSRHVQEVCRHKTQRRVTFKLLYHVGFKHYQLTLLSQQ